MYERHPDFDEPVDLDVPKFGPATPEDPDATPFANIHEKNKASFENTDIDNLMDLDNWLYDGKYICLWYGCLTSGLTSAIGVVLPGGRIIIGRRWLLPAGRTFLHHDHIEEIATRERDPAMCAGPFIWWGIGDQ